MKTLTTFILESEYKGLWKICRNCGTLNSLTRRKCKEPRCRGNRFDRTSDEHDKAELAKRAKAEETLRKLLGESVIQKFKDEYGTEWDIIETVPEVEDRTAALRLSPGVTHVIRSVNKKGRVAVGIARQSSVSGKLLPPRTTSVDGPFMTKELMALWKKHRDEAFQTNKANGLPG